MAPTNASQQITKEQRKGVIVDDCDFFWELADGTPCEPYVAFGEGKDVFAVVRYGKDIVYREHRMYCHIDDAWRILAAGRFGKWRTTDLLITLRQALRERYAQGMPLDIPKDGINRRDLEKWLTIARHYDSIHHGEATF